MYVSTYKKQQTILLSVHLEVFKEAKLLDFLERLECAAYQSVHRMI